MRFATLVGPALCIMLAGAVDAQQFVVGDLYLLSNSLPVTGKGIVRIDPITGATSVLTTYSNSANSTLTYDAYRDRLVYSDSRSTGGLVAVDAAGTRTDLAPTLLTPVMVAARGDGILYLLQSGSPYTLRYLDAGGAVHDVLDVPGAAAFQIQSGNLYDEMIYDPGTNAVFLLTGTNGGVPPPCVTPGHTCAVKIPLTGAGTQVAGTLQFTDVDVSPSAEIVVGSGRAPGGQILIVVDTNSSDSEPRMQLVDPTTMTMSAFSYNGGNYLAAGMAAGTFSIRRNQAVLIDYLSDCARAFSQGDNGSGATFATNVSGFLSRIIEIRAAGPAGVSDASPAVSAPRLDPVSPNPITASALVPFALPKTGTARLTIHDAAGRLVRFLGTVSGHAGSNSLWWDGRDDQGHRVVPGAYYFRLDAAGKSAVRKVTVLR